MSNQLYVKPIPWRRNLIATPDLAIMLLKRTPLKAALILPRGLTKGLPYGFAFCEAAQKSARDRKLFRFLSPLCW